MERDEDQVWVVHEDTRDGGVRAHLTAIEPDTGATHEVLDVTGTEDRRVVFPADDRMLLMAQRSGEEHARPVRHDDADPDRERHEADMVLGHAHRAVGARARGRRQRGSSTRRCT